MNDNNDTDWLKARLFEAQELIQFITTCSLTFNAGEPYMMVSSKRDEKLPERAQDWLDQVEKR